MGLTTKTRVGAAMKAKKSEDHILLARGLSARYCGANTPLTSLSAEEMERDLRHMEAYANACTAYAQQYYIYHNKTESEDKSKAKAPAPLIAMPVRIDPEEEKRLMNLRQKIQQCEAQREVLESQYLSLRAHYVYLSQKLKNFRKTATGHSEFLQKLVQSRGKLLALQRARLQISREVLDCLQYRQKAKLDDSMEEGDSLDMMEVWNQIDEQFKKAEQACRSEGVEEWHALKVPSIPPGVPLYLSQLAKPAGFAAAWSAGGMFGSKSDSLVWLEGSLPREIPNRERDLPGLREEVEYLKQELDRERGLNRELQGTIISRRKRNDELVAMMALLRTETEAVVARHNILLDSDQAKDAAYKLHQEELNRENNEMEVANNADDGVSQDGEMVKDELEDGEEGEVKSSSGSNGVGSTTKSKVPDEENDGDDEGEIGEDDDEEGEILEEGAVASKRNLDVTENGSPRTKRRKV